MYVVATFFTYFDHQLLWIVQEPTPHLFFLQPNDENSSNIVNYMNLSKCFDFQLYCYMVLASILMVT